MPLSRLVLVPLLVAATLPCLAQPAAAKQSPQPPILWQTPQSIAPIILLTPSVKNHPEIQARILPDLCYSIRDYQFSARSGSAMPMLKKYSTCESASLFHARTVTISPRQKRP